MPPLDVHLKNSKERTGKEYEELHLWIDDKLNSPRAHDISTILENSKYARERFGGEEASKEFLLHIKEDMEHRMKEALQNPSLMEQRVKDALQYFGLLK